LAIGNRFQICKFYGDVGGKNFPPAADDPENAGEESADEDQMQKSESNLKPDDAPLAQKESR
jgi:hypothetical protein